MKNVFRIMGLILIVAMIGLSFASCSFDCGTCQETGNGVCAYCQGTGLMWNGEDPCPSCYPVGSGKCGICKGTGKI